jgi:DNA-binding IclR family transcriptional regulator
MALTKESMRLSLIVKRTQIPTPLISKYLKILISRGDVKEEGGLYMIVEHK